MTYQETLEYLYTQLPMFQRIGAAAYKADLSNTLALCELLGHPENRFRSVHIAGTNGKGSVSSMLAAVLQSAGYKTGLFTSPHLKDFRERIRINGEMIPEQEVVLFVEHYKNDFNNIRPSFFEWTTSLAFHYFAKEQVEIAILETGMGGRLDSTNVVRPELSLITNIGFDHMQFLGDTLEKIAGEKAGIIKSEIPVIIGEVQEEIAHVFTNKADELKSPIYFAPLIWQVKDSESFHEAGISNETFSPGKYQNLDIAFMGQEKYKNLLIDLLGEYQKKNILPVLQAVNVLSRKGYHITESNVRTGLSNVGALTALRGRWQILNESPPVVADTAHNVAGLKSVLDQLQKQNAEKIHFVLGLVNDKDISNILAMLPKEAIYYFCKANIPRALPAGELRRLAMDYQLTGEEYGSVQLAYMAAIGSAKKEDLVYIGGSTFVVAEVI
ncbi:MAG TPA: folylpolyglutamate synthase/dihydrofolate synthase family protein [Bacteroidia bacterium]|nr:folylpolyglutamate synthase/dihydrofolate synthase family protein [Bacteroidia bacterium]HNS13253.1 folylpolyglutamate synthase/dihydrofolate synthase family protein [Bacteroidia bacterium]